MSPELSATPGSRQLDAYSESGEVANSEKNNITSISEWQAREAAMQAYSSAEALLQPDAEVANKGLHSLIETSRISLPEQAYENSKNIINARRAYQENTFDLKTDSVEGVQNTAFNQDISRPNAA